MGRKPAATLTHMHVCPKVEPGPVPHVGGPVVQASPNVSIGGLPAARVGDKLVCVGPPDEIVEGSSTVFINGKPAARMGDGTRHGGKIVIGNGTVMIGDKYTPDSDEGDFGDQDEDSSDSAGPRIPLVKVHSFDPQGKQVAKGKGPEMDRQLKMQEDGLNKLEVKEYIEGRAHYSGVDPCTGEEVPEHLRIDRDPQVAKDAREAHFLRKKRLYKDSLKDQGVRGKEATKQAEMKALDYMETIAALHNPDMIAGGHDKITGFGDKGVNSSIGRSWGTKKKPSTRLKAMDKAACGAKEIGNGNHLMNVSLKRCA